MKEETSPEAKVGYVYNLTTVLGDGQQLVISGNLALGASKEEMGTEFDKLVAVTNRLSAKFKIDGVKAKIAGSETMIRAMEADLKLLDESAATKWAGRPMPTAEQNNREAMVRNIRHHKQLIGEMEQEVQKLEQEAA